MSFDGEIDQFSERGTRALNEDFAAVRRHAPGDQSRGLIAAIADGVSAGGEGRMAAQTSVLSLVEDYFGAPETWDTTVVLDRIISAHNTWLVAHNRRSEASAMKTLTATRAARAELEARARRRHARLPASRWRAASIEAGPCLRSPRPAQPPDARGRARRCDARRLPAGRSVDRRCVPARFRWRARRVEGGAAA